MSETKSFNSEPVPMSIGVYHIPPDRILMKIPLLNDVYIIKDTDGRYYLDTPNGVYASKVIDDIARRCCEYSAPTIHQAVDVLFSHNECIHLSYISNKCCDQYIHLWKGEAWSLPDEYKDLHICKFFGTVPETLEESHYINIIVDATDDTPKDLPKKNIPDRSNCADGYSK